MRKESEPPLRLGGMALQNGLLLHSPRYWSAAIRKADGSIEVGSGPKKTRFGSALAARFPVARGVVKLADALLVLPQVKATMKEAVLPVEAPRVVGAIGLSALATMAVRRLPGNTILRQELAVAALSLAPAVVALKDSPIAQYHGAEHKSIGEFEREQRGEPPAGAAKEHERCGSNLVAPLVALNVLGSVALRTLSRRPSPAKSALAGLASVGTAMELFRWMSRNPQSPLSRAMSQPGHLMQRFLTTEEPSEAQMEVARTALHELLRLEGVRVEETPVELGGEASV